MKFLFDHDGHTYAKHGGDEYEANQVLCDEPVPVPVQPPEPLEPSGDDA